MLVCLLYFVLVPICSVFGLLFGFICVAVVVCCVC